MGAGIGRGPPGARVGQQRPKATARCADKCGTHSRGAQKIWRSNCSATDGFQYTRSRRERAAALSWVIACCDSSCRPQGRTKTAWKCRSSGLSRPP
eukprot:2490756-Pyramimonas_sp.AAC.1